MELFESIRNLVSESHTSVGVEEPCPLKSTRSTASEPFPGDLTWHQRLQILDSAKLPGTPDRNVDSRFRPYYATVAAGKNPVFNGSPMTLIERSPPSSSRTGVREQYRFYLEDQCGNCS